LKRLSNQTSHIIKAKHKDQNYKHLNKSSPKTVAVARPQPFSKKSPSPKKVRISSKTGQTILEKRKGKLFLNKKIKNKLHVQPTIPFPPASEFPTPGTSSDHQNTPPPPNSTTFDDLSPSSFDARAVSRDSSLSPQQPFIPPEENPLAAESPYRMFEHKRKFIVKFGVEEIIFKIAFSDQWRGESIIDKYAEIYDMFDDVLKQVKARYDPHVRCHVFINHPDLQYAKPIFIALRPIDTMTANAVLHAIEKVLNSNKGLKIDEDLVIHIGIMDIPRGGGFLKLTRRNPDDILMRNFPKKVFVLLVKVRIIPLVLHVL
jgi:hypothetical protein